MFVFDRVASNYSPYIKYSRSGQYSNVVEFDFELRHIPNRKLMGTSSKLAVHWRVVSTRKLLGFDSLANNR